MSKKVLFIDSTHEILPNRLKEAGFELDYLKTDDRNRILEIISPYIGVVIRSGIPIDKSFLNAAVSLKFIARVGAGLENIDVDYAQQKGIICLNAPEGNRDAVAEHTLGMLLTLSNNLFKSDAEVRQGIWLREENRGFEIMGKTIALIGYGNMGSAVAQRLTGFSSRIIAYDKYKFGYGDENVKEVGMTEVFEQADILSLHIPLTEETRYLCNADWFNSFKKPIIFINTSRGEIVKTDDLVKALQEEKIKGACLDVLEYEGKSFEKLSNLEINSSYNYLKNSNKVVLSPHIAGWTIESNIKLANVIADKILDLVIGD